MPETIGPYRIVSELGRGAMGVVYHAFDAGIGRPVAIKVIRVGPDATADESAQLRQRLIREASAAGKLSHANIVTVYQLGEEGRDVFIAMEFVQGTSLADAMKGTPLGRFRTQEILRQIADGLDYAHHAGVVHRDIKPANILIRQDGCVKIADFGIAKMVESTTQQMTQVGFSIGSPAYMSPEQVRAEQVDGRSDQFSLAVMAFEMLAGHKPFAADSVPGLMHQIVAVDPLATAEARAAVPPGAAAALAKALSKNASDRYPNCAAFVQALQADAVPAAAPRPEPAPPAPRAGAPPPKRSFAIPLLVLMAVLLAAGGYWWVSRKKPTGATGAVTAGPSTTAPSAAATTRAESPLVKAIAEGKLDEARKLIANGADVNATNPDGTSPLMQAAEGSGYMPNNAPAVAMLLEKPVQIDAQDSRGRTALYRATAEGKEEAMRLLVEHKADINRKAADGTTPLMAAVTYGKVGATKYLLDQGADVELADTQGNRPLMIASEGTGYLPYNPPLVEALLAKGAKIDAQDARGRTAFYRGAAEGKNEAVNLLLAKKAEVNQKAGDGTTPLLTVVTYGKLETAKILLKNGADVNLPDPAGNTPLMVAAEGTGYMPNNAPMVETLLAGGAKVDAVDARGRTPFYRAAAEGKLDAMRLLLDKKADPNTRAVDGSTALLQAVSYDKLESVKLLLEKGANPNIADSNGTTPLMAAAEASGYIKNPAELIALLLAHGAKSDMVDNRGRTALARATETKNAPAIEALKKK